MQKNTANSVISHKLICTKKLQPINIQYSRKLETEYINNISQADFVSVLQLLPYFFFKRFVQLVLDFHFLGTGN